MKTPESKPATTFSSPRLRANGILLSGRYRMISASVLRLSEVQIHGTRAW